MPDPLELVLSDGRPATLLLGEASTVLAIGDTIVSSWDLGGRPYALVREEGTYRRGLDGGLLRKREAGAAADRVRQRLTAAQGAPAVEAARAEAVAALAALALHGAAPPEMLGEARARLKIVAQMDETALRSDAERFLAACGPVGILPPDQYLSLVVRVTEGCTWNACRFCRLYAGMPFRVKTEDELRRHVAALREYFGRSLALRRSVFLGDANALALTQARLVPRLEIVAAGFPNLPLFSFVDAWTGQRRTAAEWGACRGLGLARVYVGVESGDPELLAWLGKPGSSDDARRLVDALHEGGVEIGVILLVGAGGERFAASHVARTRELLAAMALGRRDIVYFSQYLDDPHLPLGRESTAPDLAALPAEPARLQREAIADAVRAPSGPRLARYDLSEFVY